MAQFLATTTTLANMTVQVRGQLGVVSEQESGIISLEMNDIIHQAITNLRTILGSIVKDFYITKGTILTAGVSGTTPNFTVDISAKEIADVHDLALYHTTFGEIPILPLKKYNAYRTLYTASDVGTTKAFAAVANTETALATQSVLTMNIYSNAAATSAFNNTEFSYPRFPKKVTTGTNTLDFPEIYMPLLRDVATVYMEKRISRTPSADVVNAIKNVIDPLIALGITQLNSLEKK